MRQDDAACERPRCVLPRASCAGRKPGARAQVCPQSAAVRVDRDQRWVFGCFGGLCSPHRRRIDGVRPATETPNLTLSITGSTQESMVHCTHRHAVSLPVCRALPSSAAFFVPATPPPPESTPNPRNPASSRESRVHKPLFIGRTGGTIDLVLPRARCGWCIKLFFFLASLDSWSHPRPTLGSFQTPHLLVMCSVTQHLTHALRCRRRRTFPEGLAPTRPQQRPPPLF